jgi:hypothetical protein
MLSGNDVSSVSIGRAVEIAERFISAVHPNASLPLALRPMPTNALVATRVIGALPRVGLVLRTSRQPQVGPAVIAGNAVDVVDLIGRPLACHVEPSKAMGKVKPPIDADVAVAAPVHPPRHVADANISVRFHESCENARGGIVVQKFAKPFGCHFDTGWGCLKLNAVIAGAMPFRRSKGSRSGNLAAGRPFFFQFETVFGLTPVARAKAKVPPKASMISAAVASEFMGCVHSPIPGIVNSQDARDNDSDARKCQVVPLSQGTG